MTLTTTALSGFQLGQSIGSQVWQPVGFDGGGWVWVESSRCGGSLAAPGRPSGRYKQGPWLLDDADNNGNFWIRSCYERSDRKSTRLNSSHGYISYAVFCLTKK